MRLQKAFFIFITQIMQKYVQILEVNTQDNDEERSNSISNFKLNLKKEPNQNEEDLQRKKLAIQAGQYFHGKFKESSKYVNFVVNFLQFHDTIDVYKIPYTFFSEFIYYSHVAEKNNLSEVDVFRLIDKFYGKVKRLNLDEEIKSIKNKGKDNKHKKKEKKIENNLPNNVEKDEDNYIYFRFDNFAHYYLNNLKSYMEREQEDDKEYFQKVKRASTRNKFFSRRGFVLSNKILMKYIHYLNNLDNPKKEFKFLDNQDNIKIEIIDRKVPFESYQLVEISEVVERHFIMERCFTSYGLIKFSLLNVLAITRTFYKGNYIKSREDIKKMCEFCRKTKSLVRKYMFIYLNIFNNLKLNGLLEENICDECAKVITNYFNEANMIPTEAISKTLYDIKSTPSNNTIELKDSNQNTKKNIKKGPFTEGGSKINGVSKNYYFNLKDKKLKKSAFVESLSIIEAVFTGNFKNLPMVDDSKDLKFFEDNFTYHKNYLKKRIPKGTDKSEKKSIEREINKKKFDLKTPLVLYKDTYNSLNTFLKKYSIEDLCLEDLYWNILCLIYYFKIPIIEDKWVETLRNPDKVKAKLLMKEKQQLKDKTNEKNKDKKKDKDKTGEEGGVVKNKEKDNNLNELIGNTIPDIIQMLTELFVEVKKLVLKQKKNNKK